MRPSQNGVKSRLAEVKVQDIAKRKDKNLDYILIVKWSNGDQNTIARQYSMFFDLQNGLKQICKAKPSITIPELPVPKFPGAMLFSSLAKKESKVIEEFCQRIIRLPSLVSDIVERFFSEWGTDAVYQDKQKRDSLERNPAPSSVEHTNDNLVEKYRAMAKYKASTNGEMNLDENEVVTVIEKNQTGWWLVTKDNGQHGFAPATFLEPLDPNRECECEEWIDHDSEPRVWVAIQPYRAQSHDEVSYSKGEEMELIATSNFGWWKVRYHGKIGVTPASNLEPKQERYRNLVDNPTYVTAVHPTTRRSSFTSVGPIYASIRRPPPRRDSSKEKLKRAALPNPDNAKTLEYAVVNVGNPKSSSSASASSSDENPDVLYSTVIPKHLRPPPSKAPKSSSPERTYEEIKEDRAPTLPPCFANSCDDKTLPTPQEEQYLEPIDSNRRLSTDETATPSDRVKHGYLNVSNGSNLFKVIADYDVPPDRYEDLPVSVGCVVRALIKDGSFYCVSTLDEPPRQGWVPENILQYINGAGRTANRRSRSMGDIMHESSKDDPEVAEKLKELHNKTPVAAPRLEKRRYLSFDATETNSTKEENVDVYETISGIESLKLSELASSAPWYYGKLKRQTCEEIMLKTANELDFLVRESSQKFASYVLSVKFSRKIRHFPIETTPSKKFVIGKHAFDSLPEIINFYTENPLFYTQNKEPVSLGQPFKRS